MMHSILSGNNLPCFKESTARGERKTDTHTQKKDSKLTAQFLMVGGENPLKADVASVFFREEALKGYMAKIGFCWRLLDCIIHYDIFCWHDRIETLFYQSWNWSMEWN